MAIYSSGNHMVPDVEKDLPPRACPKCGCHDIAEGKECNDCLMLTETFNPPCDECGGQTAMDVYICENCEHAWKR